MGGKSNGEGKKPIAIERLHQKSGTQNSFGGYAKVNHGNGTFSMKKTKRG